MVRVANMSSHGCMVQITTHRGR